MGSKSQRNRLSAHPLPPEDWEQRVLPISECQVVWYRLNPSRHASALYFDRSGMGRYDGSRQSYGILYVAETVEGAFIESFGRTHGAKGVAEEDLKNRNLFEIKSDRSLRLVDLFGSGLVKIGADARITSGSDYETSRAWGEAIYLHPLKVDGIRYYSRHDNTQFCCGLFERTSTHLNEQNRGNLVNDNAELLADILERYDYALL